MIKGVIFDLDGVLVSTDKMHYLAWKRISEELGIFDFTEEDNIRQRGVSRMDSLEIVLEKGTKKFSDEEKQVLAERKNGYYIELLQQLDKNALLPLAIETLNMLREKGYLVAVGSVSKNTPLILSKTGLAPYIDKVSCGLDITRSKPDPEVFLVAADKLALDPSECLVVEDSAAGIVAAKAAGMKSLGVGPYYDTLKADVFYRSFMDIKDWESILSE